MGLGQPIFPLNSLNSPKLALKNLKNTGHGAIWDEKC